MEEERVSAKCPHCGKEIKLIPGVIMRCPYCGRSVVKIVRPSTIVQGEDEEFFKSIAKIEEEYMKKIEEELKDL